MEANVYKPIADIINDYILWHWFGIGTVPTEII